MQRLLSGSLRVRLTILVLLVVTVPIVLVILITSYTVSQDLREEAERDLRQSAEDLTDRVSSWDQQLTLALRNLSKQPDIVSMDADRQKPVLSQMASVYSNLYLVHTTDETGFNIARNDDEELRYYGDRSWFKEAIVGNEFARQTLIGRTTDEPAICVGSPIRDEQAQNLGVVSVCTDLDVLTEQIGATRLDNTGFAFLLNESNQVLAHPNEAYAKDLEDLSDDLLVKQARSGQHEFSTFVDENGTRWLFSALSLDNDWMVIVQQEEAEVLARVRTLQFGALGLTILLILTLAGLMWWVAGYFVNPIVRLTDAAKSLSTGQLRQIETDQRRDEVGVLTNTFNEMAQQLNHLIDSLEHRVASRTQRLETVAAISERLNSILNFEELLAAIVTEVQDKFGYYHAHIYLLDDSGERLVVAEGTGSAGKKMKMSGHNIQLNAETSLVARAARTGEIVWVDNVRETPDWLPNELLPNTYSEMAVPIVLDGQVVGVLDVQSDQINGLDDGDANVLRSLANQVTVALRNARLFEKVETALAEAHEAQRRYQQEAWQKVRKSRGTRRYVFTRPGVQLDKTEKERLDTIKPQQLAKDGSTLVDVNTGQSTGQAITAPINLGDLMIGKLQLQTTRENRQTWSDEDLYLIEDILNQFVQTAETLRLFDETRKNASRETTIRTVTDKLRAAPSLDRLLEIATTEISQLFSVNYAELELGAEGHSGNDNVNGSNGTHSVGPIPPIHLKGDNQDG
ncbi:MAG: GAF domain-containing protein [Anaerolineae bacterium]|nr:GAF domain-containing protein [Anaerolineae bacterium]